MHLKLPAQAGSAADLHEWLEVISATIRTIRQNTQPPWGIPGQLGVGWSGGSPSKSYPPKADTAAGRRPPESPGAEDGSSMGGSPVKRTPGGRRRLLGKMLRGAMSLGSCSTATTSGLDDDDGVDEGPVFLDLNESGGGDRRHHLLDAAVARGGTRGVGGGVQVGPGVIFAVDMGVVSNNTYPCPVVVPTRVQCVAARRSPCVVKACAQCLGSASYV